MKLREFEGTARRMWEEIPDEYREGIDGLVVERRALPHPTLPEIYTLGECVTEAYPSDYGGPETIRSIVVLYWGSFQKLAALNEAFDWDDEIWETLTHELRHHLESLADEAALEGVDYAADQNFRRVNGESFDPFFFRAGEEAAEGVWRVEREFFLERRYATDEEPGPEIEFGWHGERYRVPRPERLGDVCFIEIDEGVDTGPALLVLVLVREHGVLASLRALIRRTRPEIEQWMAAAEAVDAGGGDDAGGDDAGAIDPGGGDPDGGHPGGGDPARGDAG